VIKQKLQKFRFSNLGSIKEKVLTRRKKIWNLILILSITFYINMNTCQALPELPFTPSKNVIHPEETIEVVNHSPLSNVKETKNQKRK
jgi:hypothetical protein